MDLGINLAGMEYQTFSEAQLEYFAAKGFSDFRLTINWDILQPTLHGTFDARYLAQIRKVVDDAKSLGMDVILDIHNYGMHDGKLIGTPDVPVAAFADLWGRMAHTFAADTNVSFGLMNEPQQDSAAAWLPAVNAAIAAIRAEGATQQVFVSGTYWDGAQSWTTTDNATVLGAPGAIEDPAGNFAFEVHLYMDDTSGQNPWVVSETIGVERLTAITEWARATGNTLYLGEFGVADNAASKAALTNAMDYLQANGDVWQGASYWAAGTLPPGYIYSADPLAGMLDTGQMDVLEKYVGAHTATAALADGRTQIATTLEGATMPSVVDVLDATNTLVSRAIFGADGVIERTLVRAANATSTVTSYGDDGVEVTSVKVYDASHQRVAETAFNADGSFLTKDYTPGGWQPVREEYHDAAGLVTLIVDYAADGITGNSYVDGKLARVEHYDGTWALAYRLTYDAAGKVVNCLSIDAVGHNVVEQIDAATGYVIERAEYSAQWSMLGRTHYTVAQAIRMSVSVAHIGPLVVEASPGFTAFDTNVLIPAGLIAVDPHAIDTDALTYTLADGDHSLTFTGTGDFTGTGNALDNAIVGGAGNDLLDGGAGADTMTGGAGNDVYIVDAAGDRVVELASGGYDTVRTKLVTYTLSDHVERLTFLGTGAFAGIGNAIDNLIEGGAGSDRLEGLDGNDQLLGGIGQDQLFGGAGADVLDGGRNEDSLYGGIGNDTISGGAHVDQIYGEDGDDVLIGDFADAVAGSAPGNDKAWGGDGDDVIYGDQIRFASGIAGKDYLYGDAGDDLILGDADVATGGTMGNDYIEGGAGDDWIYGDARTTAAGVIGGNDRIYGGAGNDHLFGGGGNDVFYFQTRGFGNDVVHDFGQKAGDRDIIDLNGLHLKFTDLAIRYTATGATIELPTHETITLLGVSALTSADFYL